MSIGWYARLELGQLDSIAPQTLASVARALKLDHHETAYLFALSRTPVPPPDDDNTEVAKPFRVLVERYTSGSAMIIGPRCDVLVSNAMAENAGFSSAGTGLERNLAWQFFTKPFFRERVIEWHAVAGMVAAHLRESYAHHVGDSAFEELIDALQRESDVFARYWDDRFVSPPSALTMHLRVADGGIIEVARATTALIDAPGHYLTFLTPLDPNDLPRLRAERWSLSTAS